MLIAINGNAVNISTNGMRYAVPFNSSAGTNMKNMKREMDKYADILMSSIMYLFVVTASLLLK